MKILLMFFTIIIMFIPTEFFILLKYLVGPVGFWQNLFFFGIGLYFLFGLQVTMFCIGVVVLYFTYKGMFTK
jgi:hypothetical protein